MWDAESAWAALGRELFKTCESVRAEGRCPAGTPTFHWLIRHSIVVQVSEKKRRLWITRDTSSEEEIRFQLKCLLDERTPPEIMRIAVVGDSTFRIDEAERHFTTSELCNELLNMICRDR